MTDQPKRPKFAPDDPRYAGKPFLLFTEFYVLDVIGQLADEQSEVATKFAPAMGRALGIEGSWQEIVAKVMRFPPSLPAVIERVWQGYLDHHHPLGNSVDPHEFAREFIDTNFGDKD